MPLDTYDFNTVCIMAHTIVLLIISQVMHGFTRNVNFVVGKVLISIGSKQ